LGGILAAILRSNLPARMSEKGIYRMLVGLGVGSIIFLAQGNAWIRTLGVSWSAFRNPSVALSLRLLAINLMYFSLIGLVIVHSGHRWLALLRDGRLGLLGQMSYGIYLYHYFLFDIVQDYADYFGVTNRVAIDSIKLSASFAIALASWRLIEQPLLSLKDRFAYPSRPFPVARPSSELDGLESLPSGAQ
jgi:peptidoglycan/LPS O-acetylase OafA/YrhL